jgi:hypothetical protein
MRTHLDLYCFCDKQAVLKLVAKPGINHGRFFWTCSNPWEPVDHQCGFFIWDDNEREEWFEGLADLSIDYYRPSELERDPKIGPARTIVHLRERLKDLYHDALSDTTTAPHDIPVLTPHGSVITTTAATEGDPSTSRFASPPALLPTTGQNVVQRLKYMLGCINALEEAPEEDPKSKLHNLEKDVTDIIAILQA